MFKFGRFMMEAKSTNLDQPLKQLHQPWLKPNIIY
jgi:hypothetical protein